MPLVQTTPGLQGSPLVGDLIVDTRILGPDPPQTATVPGLSVAAIAVTSGALPAGTYQQKITGFTNWGETLPSTEASVVILAGQSIQVTGSFPPGIVAGRIYLSLAGGAAGSELSFFQFTSLPATVDSTKLMGGIPPTKSSAWLPDTDGQFISASIIYAWIRDALEKATIITGGIEDLTGAPSVLGSPIYVLPGRWSSLTDFWYDGYLVKRGTRRDNYYRAPLVSISWNVSRVQGFQQWAMELFPQPQRTAGTGTLSSALAAGDTVANVSFTRTFTLPLGLARIGGVGGEIVYYSGTSATQLTGLTRGYSGTVPQSFASGAPVDELNINARGKRYPTVPLIGQSNNPLDIPVGWYAILHQYMMYRYRLLEQDHAAAKEMDEGFTANMNQWLKSNRQETGPKQSGGPAGIEVFFPGGAPGYPHGWIVP